MAYTRKGEAKKTKLDWIVRTAGNDRRSITERLHRSARAYWATKMFSVHHEVGILPWGKRKVDLFCFDMKHNTVICEVKSGAADFNADQKYEQYIPYCHAFYFVISEEYWQSKACDRLKEAAKRLGAGVLVLPTGGRTLVSMMRASKRTELPPYFLKTTITKLAWRLGFNRSNYRSA